MRTALAGLLAAALLTPSIDAPRSAANPKEGAFGFTEGMTLKQVRAVAKIEKVPGTRSSYVTRKPPAPVDHLRVYTLIVSPEVGLCSVAATSDDAPDYVGVKEADVEDIANSLLARYGRPGWGHTSPDTRRRHILSVWWGRLGPGSAIRLSVSTDYVELTRSVTVTYDFGNVACLGQIP